MNKETLFKNILAGKPITVLNSNFLIEYNLINVNQCKLDFIYNTRYVRYLMVPKYEIDIYILETSHDPGLEPIIQLLKPAASVFNFNAPSLLLLETQYLVKHARHMIPEGYGALDMFVSK